MKLRSRDNTRIAAQRLFFCALFVCAPALAGNRAAPFVGVTFEDTACVGDSVGNGSGPWDYMERAGLAQSLQLVENHHFTPQVENLVRGQTSPNPVSDIFFTLTYWPNHHRALNSLSIYSRRAQARGERLNPPAECWLQRAVSFNPKDATTRMLYAIHLHRAGHKESAAQEYQTASKLAPSDLFISYNYGLLLFDMNNFEAAGQMAHKVYSNGFPLPGLRKKLEASGHPVP
ncbi:MAG: hypothetical protein H6985_09775 [Pseudomonadales bacterium]|nr:hypothetical protein [Halioglobus sp.]MCP5129858.1 hypothetical protein [Pseudomonadales bacterium]